MAKTVYLHIGSGKAGSSALQYFFDQNTEVFARKGYAYPPPLISEEMKRLTARNQYHIGNGWGLIRPNPQFSEDELEEFRQGIDCNQSLVFSSEHLVHSSQRNLEDIRKDFEGYCFKIIYYIRRIDSAFQSALNNQIQLGNISFSPDRFDEVADRLLRAFPTFGHLNRFREVFGRESIVIRPYEKGQFSGGTIFSDFLSILGLDIEDGFVVPEQRINPSLPKEYLEIRRVLADPALIDNKPAQQAFSAALFELAHEGGPSKGKAAADLISPAQKLRLIERYHPFYEHVAREYLGRSDGRLFYDPLPDPAVSWEYDGTMSLEKVVLLFGKLFAKQLARTDPQGSGK